MAIPIITSGGSEAIGRSAADNLKPEYEGTVMPNPAPPLTSQRPNADTILVICFLPESTVDRDLPLVLKGEVPAEGKSGVGSGNWSEPPKALILGGSYSNEAVERLRKLIDETPGVSRIPWLHLDPAKVTLPIGPGYGLEVAARTKETLKKLETEGKLNGNDGGLYLI